MGETVLDQHAVLAGQRDDIADGADRGKVGVILEQPFHVGILALDRLNELEGNADAG